VIWQNRITGYGEEAPDQLLANPKNWRIHPKFQQDALAGVLREVGIVQNVIVNQRTGFVVDGHLRVGLALREGQENVPITYVDLSEAEEALILATLDPIGAQAATDAAKLDDLLRDVTTGDAGVQALLARIHGDAPDVGELWQGMPEFEQEDHLGWKTLIVHFENEQDYEAFARLVEQAMTRQTKYIWYPAQDKIDALSHRVADES
jgi:hypothetical protein